MFIYLKDQCCMLEPICSRLVVFRNFCILFSLKSRKKLYVLRKSILIGACFEYMIKVMDQGKICVSANLLSNIWAFYLSFGSRWQ